MPGCTILHTEEWSSVPKCYSFQWERPRNEKAENVVPQGNRPVMEEHPVGALFRDTRGRPWTKNALVCRFRRLSETLGTSITAYAFRHTFCTEALERGVDSTTVAVLMGHRDTTMVAKVYSHLTHNQKHLQAALRKARGDARPRRRSTRARESPFVVSSLCCPRSNRSKRNASKRGRWSMGSLD